MSARVPELRAPCFSDQGDGPCEHWIVVREASTPAHATCAVCNVQRDLRPEGRDPNTGGLRACLACGHPELFSKKDFPRGLGITVVVVAAVLAPFTYYISLGVAAVLDFVLYRAMPEVQVCYVCQSEHRRFPADPRHPSFDREIEERLLYGQKAVMGKPMRPGGTADAPEPEH